MHFRHLSLAILFSTVAFAAPEVFWASDPVQPDDTVLVTGAGFSTAPKVELRRLDDGNPSEPGAKLSWPGKAASLEALQPSETSVKFVLPKTEKPGIYVGRVDGSAPFRLNAPTVYWCQGDVGTTASPGGWVRVFGRCLTGDGQTPTVLLQPAQGTPLRLKAQDATRWQLTAPLPGRLAEGDYRVFVHNGWGGKFGWSDSGTIQVAAPERWPSKVFDLSEFGARGDGSPGDGACLRAALKAAEENGGGVVYIPHGRYSLQGTLEIPKYVVLRGERTDLVALCWPDNNDPYTLVEGTDHFGLENLTIYGSNYVHVIAGSIGQPDSGHTFLRKVRVRADMYRGHLKPEQVDERFRQSLKRSSGGGDTVRLGGEDVQITDCDLYGSGRSLYLLRVRGALVKGNTLYNGRWGWYCLDGSDRLILEHNSILGADLQSTGGGLACYTSAYSQNVYYAHNTLQKAHGWDREAMTTDAGYGAYYGTVTNARPDQFTLTEDAGWSRKQDWTGAGVFILGGRGMGQYRKIKAYDGREVTVDRPWDVLPDEQSVVTITMFHGNYLFIGNSFEDVGISLQYYGTSIDNVAASNVTVRGGGFYNSGRWYRHFQPSWFCQFFENEIREGNCYRFGPNNAEDAGVSYLGTFGLQVASKGGTAPLAYASVHRRNHLYNNAQLKFIGVDPEHPGLQDLVADHNTVENTSDAVYMDDGCVGVLLRENTFRNVEHELMTPAMIRAAQLKRRAAYLDRQDPVAVYDFDHAVGRLAANAAGNDFTANATGDLTYEPSLSGQAPRFDGDSYFQVSDDAMLQFPRLTVSAWILPDQLKGRWGVVAKRSRGGLAPYILTIREGAVSFEATDAQGQWSYNFSGKRVLREHQWNQIAAVCEEGVGVKLYCNGELVGEKQVTAPLCSTTDVLTIGYENWGGPEAKASDSGNFHGLIDEVKIWSRLLKPEELKAEYDRLKDAAAEDLERRAKEAAAQAALQQKFEGQIVSAGGVDWQLVLADDFERATLGGNWQSLRGKWTMADGHVSCRDTSFLGCTKPVGSPVRIEFDARSKAPGDLTAFWGTEQGSFYDGYFFGFASDGNTGCKLLRLGENVAVKEGMSAKPNQWYHVIAQVIGGKLQLIVDGKLALEWTDKQPLTKPNMAGVLAWSEGEFDNVRIYTGK